MRPHSWIVVANSTKARFIQAENLQTFEEMDPFQLSDFFTEDDMPSDQLGRAYESVGHARHAMEPKTLPKNKIAMHFARKIAEKMEQGHNNGDFDWVYLFAPPHFLGILRKELHPNVTKTIVAEFDKDLIQSSIEEIKKHFSI